MDLIKLFKNSKLNVENVISSMENYIKLRRNERYCISFLLTDNKIP